MNKKSVKSMAFILCLCLALTVWGCPIGVQATEYPLQGTVNDSGVRLRSGPGTDHSILGVMDLGVQLTVTGEQYNAKDEMWYSVTLPSGQSGYIISTYVTVNDPQEQLAVTTDNGVNVRMAPGTWNPSIYKLSYGVTVTVLGVEKDRDGDEWYCIRFSNDGKPGVGYVFHTLLRFVSSYTPNPDFEQYMDEQGFPESYKPYLRQLHAEYPNWIFLGDKMPVTWSQAMEIESRLGTSLVQTTYQAWKTMEKGAYDWESGTYRSFDSGNWVAAHPDVVAYYLDPRNFLNSASVFQFVGMSYNPAVHNKATLQTILEGTFMEGSFPEEGYDTWADVLMDAAVSNGMSPYALAAMILLEQGRNGIGASISGVQPGYEGYYNFLNIRAYAANGNSAVTNGLIYASGSGSYGRPWNSRAKSIKGGAAFYAQGYIAVGQDTLYLKKFDLKTAPYGTHQYMSNIQGANGEAASTQKAYQSMTDADLVFQIPVYEGMPDAPAAYPTTQGNNNYYLNNLEIQSFSLDQSFDLYTNGYTASVPYEASSVCVSAVPKDRDAVVVGVGETPLQVGENRLEITVTATSGRQNTYLLTVTRAEPSAYIPPSYQLDSFTREGALLKNIAPYTDLSSLVDRLAVQYGSVRTLSASGIEKSGCAATGDILVIDDTLGEEYARFTLCVTGDLNGDGKITLLDLAWLQRHILGIETQTGANAAAADVDGDSAVTQQDLTRLQEHLLQISLLQDK